MRYKRIIFIYPDYPSTSFTMPVVPLGIGYLAELLKQNDIKYHILDMRLGHKFPDLKRLITNTNPDAIGISLMSFMYLSHYKFIDLLKREFPHLPIIAGGPHISTCKTKVLKECRSIDFGIMQEGEIPLLSLCQGKPLSAIAGLLYREGGQIAVNALDLNYEADLDKLPFPRYDNFELDKYGYGISIVSSRGCPYKCIYCTASVTRKKFRARSVQSIIGEIEYWHRRGYREFDLQEDNPTFNRERMLELCQQIKKRGFRHLVIMCGNGVRADKVDRELLSSMKDAGFKRLGFGVEAGNNKVLKSIKKGETIEVVKKAIQEACDLGFFVSLFFLIGSPEETISDVQDSIDIALSYPISHVNFFNLIPLPETELYSWVERNDYFLLKPQDYLNIGPAIQMGCCPVFETPYFRKEERIKTLKRCKKIERFIKRRTISKTLTKIFPLNYLVAWCYMLPVIQSMENQLLKSLLYRKTINSLRNRIRMLFYK